MLPDLTLVEMLRLHAMFGGPCARTDEIGAKISDIDLLNAAADELERQDAEITRLRGMLACAVEDYAAAATRGGHG